MTNQQTKNGLYIFIFIWLILNTILIFCNAVGLNQDVKDTKDNTIKIIEQLESNK